MSMESLTPLIIEYRYWLLIPLSFIEGPIIAFVTGTLSRLGYFNAYLAFAIFFFRDVILDSFFYFLGKYGGKTALAQKLLAKIGVNDAHLEDVRGLWEKHGFRTMFFSKLSYGLSATFLLVAGIVDMNLGKFMRYAALVALAQYGVLFVLGYFFGNSFGSVANVLNNLQYIIAVVLLVATGYYIFTHFMRTKLIEQEKQAEDESDRDAATR